MNNITLHIPATHSPEVRDDAITIAGSPAAFEYSRRNARSRLAVVRLILSVTLFLLLSPSIRAQTPPASPAPAPSAVDSARAVIRRFIGDRASEIHLIEIPAVDNCDVYEVDATDGIVTIKGNTGVALSHGFYDYCKQAGLGIATWTGNRFDCPSKWPDAGLRRVLCPYQYRFYFNVVTYGYSMPYWTWERWEREIDWMALHGINMPLALVAAEGIGARVWKEQGMTQQDIDAFYTGPAYLPWLRMGNIASHDGPLPESWLSDQIALEHKILDRMRLLGMQPIVPAFAGFVPPQFKGKHPGVQLTEAHWGGFAASKSTRFLSPASPLFLQIGKRYVELWEQEFGKCRFFLADSFNEMALPASGTAVNDMLASYGENIYKSIAAGDPEAVWTVQGWMFGYQRNIWNPNTVRALFSKVPDDKVQILDLANDYNAEFWHNGSNWELFHGFFGKPWVYSVIPNMGGNTGYTGVMSFYASDSARVLNSPNRGKEVGFGFAPEGIENNTPLYELLSDVAWRKDPVNLDEWLKTYCLDRYGAYPPEVKHAWDLLRQTCYASFTDHPRFGWQTGGFAGTVDRDPKFCEAVKSFLAASDQLQNSALYRADAVEMTAICLGLKADDWLALANQASDCGDQKHSGEALAHGLDLLSGLDRLLESHPLDRLERWLDFARSHGATDAEKKYYESDARRIVTVWGPPVNDYAARLWSGLIRDFYRERVARYFDSVRTGKPFDRAAFEEQWVNASGVSPCVPFTDPLAAAKDLIEKADAWPVFDWAKTPVSSGALVGEWRPNQLSTEWKTLEWRFPPDLLKTLSAVGFEYVSGRSRLEIQSVAIVSEGKIIAKNDHFGFAGVPNARNVYPLQIPDDINANNDVLIRATVKTPAESTDSTGKIYIVKRQ